MAEKITPTVREAEDDSQKVGVCGNCGKTLTINDRIMECDVFSDWNIWCVDQECEKEMAWQLYSDTCNEMSEQDKKWSV